MNVFYITQSTVIKAKKNVITTPNDSTVYVMLPEAGEIHVLNETATFLWNLSKSKAVSVRKLIKILESGYSVGHIRAKNDVLNFVEFYYKKGIFSIVQKKKKKI